MSVATSIASITDARNTIRNKMVSLGIGLSTDKLDALATKLAAVVDNGAVDIEIQEGDTYTIPAGFHNGSGTVSAVSGGGSYTLQSKECTPTKAQQSITPDAGKYGLSSVTVLPIPAAYQDVSSTTATAADVKAGTVFIASDGTTTTGTMVNNGAVTATIDGLTSMSYTIPAGYHDGTGTVSLTSDIEDALDAI